jgi:hypothetical protein
MMESSGNEHKESGSDGPVFMPSPNFAVPYAVSHKAEVDGEITAPGTSAYDELIHTSVDHPYSSPPEYLTVSTQDTGSEQDKIDAGLLPHRNLSPADRVASMFDMPTSDQRTGLSELRLRPELYEQDTTTYRQAGRFEECEAAHTEQTELYDAAQAELFEIMGISTDTDPQDPYGFDSHVHQAWFRPKGALMAPGDPERLFAVTVRTKNGKLYGNPDEPAVTVTGYPVHTPQQYMPDTAHQLRGLMTGKIIFDSDAKTSNIRIESIEPPKSLDAMAEPIASYLRYDARLGALKPWVEDYRQLPLPPEDAALREHDAVLFGQDGYDMAYVVTLRRNFDPTDHEIELTLRGACDDAPHTFRNMPDVPQAEFDRHVGDLGPTMATRYRWLLDNIAAMRGASVQAGREAVVFGFADTFLDELKKGVEPRVERLQALTDTLGGMERADDAAPSQELPAQAEPPETPAMSDESRARMESWLRGPVLPIPGIQWPAAFHMMRQERIRRRPD